jgi:uncharacterized protein (TIGR02266 family)
VDEFIEQYARDISRGGLFIKSKQPMAIGTLLKFEFQLKDESKLIQGVGRVVWKREPTDADGDTKPSGMGIKFIKMEPESKALVEQIVEGRGEGPGQYESGAPAGALEGEGEDGAAAASGAAKGARPVRSQKATMQFFPSTTPASELPAPEDRTQVRHASEFLASALASGGVDDLASKEAEKKAEEARKRTEEIEKQREAQTRAVREEEERAAREKAEREKAERERQEREEQEREKKAAAKAAADKAALEAAATAAATEATPKSEPKKAPSERPAAKTASVPPKKAAPAVEPAPAPDGGSNMVLPIAAVLLLGLGIGGYWYLNHSGGGGDTVTTGTTGTEPGTTGTEPAAAGTEPGGEGTEPGGEGTEPGGEGTEPGATGTEPGGEGTEPGATGTEPGGEEPPPPAPTFEVRIETTPPGATLMFAGAEIGTSPATVSLPEGTQAVTARLAGHAEGTAEIAVAEGARPTRITLTSLPFAVEVTTTPPGARLRIGTRTGTAPGRVEITRPTGPVRVTASLTGYTDATTTLDPATFAETDGTMVASVTLNLSPRPRTGGTRPGGGTGGGATGGGTTGGGTTGGGETGTGGGTGGGETGSGGGTTGGGETGSGGTTGGGTTGGGTTGGGTTGGGTTGGGETGGGETGGGSEPVPDNPF